MLHLFACFETFKSRQGGSLGCFIRTFEQFHSKWQANKTCGLEHAHLFDSNLTKKGINYYSTFEKKCISKNIFYVKYKPSKQIWFQNSEIRTQAYCLKGGLSAINLSNKDVHFWCWCYSQCRILFKSYVMTNRFRSHNTNLPGCRTSISPVWRGTLIAMPSLETQTVSSSSESNAYWKLMKVLIKFLELICKLCPKPLTDYFTKAKRTLYIYIFPASVAQYGNTCFMVFDRAQTKAELFINALRVVVKNELPTVPCLILSSQSIVCHPQKPRFFLLNAHIYGRQRFLFTTVTLTKCFVIFPYSTYKS